MEGLHFRVTTNSKIYHLMLRRQTIGIVGRPNLELLDEGPASVVVAGVSGGKLPRHVPSAGIKSSASLCDVSLSMKIYTELIHGNLVLSRDAPQPIYDFRALE